MAIWSGPGPVFEFESLVAARRWAYYAARSGFGLLLLIGLGVVWTNLDRDVGDGASEVSRDDLARLGAQFFHAIAGIQITLILLVAPAATAGSICLDRARGTLAHVFVTDLSDVEIVLGKLAARLAPVVALVAAATPVLALAGLLGGVVPEAVLALEVVSIGLAVLGCSLALAVSARVAKAHEVLMAVYAVLILWLLSVPYWYGLSVSYAGTVGKPPDWFVKFNPYVLAFLPYEPNNTLSPTGLDLPVYLLALGGASAVFTLVAVWTLRREVRPEARRSERLDQFFARARARFYSWWPSPSLDGNPVLWREWHRNRPSRIARRLWAVYWGVGAVSTAYGIYEVITDGVQVMRGPGWIVPTNAFLVAFGMLFLSATAPTALTEERVRGSLDVLMATPLRTRTIVLGKWWAVFRVVPVMAVLPGLGALIFALGAEPTVPASMVRWYPHVKAVTAFDRFNAVAFPVAWVFAHGALFTSVGLALATWVARPGRAIGLSVAFYLALLVGVPFAVESVVIPMARHVFAAERGSEGVQNLEGGLLAVSPFFGPFVSLQAIGSPFQRHDNGLWVLQALTLTTTYLLAGAVLAFTVLTFDRRLGRVSDLSELDDWVVLTPAGPVKSWQPKRLPETSHLGSSEAIL